MRRAFRAAGSADLRGSRLHRLDPTSPAFLMRGGGRSPLASRRIRLLNGRRCNEDAAPPLDGGDLEAGDADPPHLRHRRRRPARAHHRRPGRSTSRRPRDLLPASRIPPSERTLFGAKRRRGSSRGSLLGTTAQGARLHVRRRARALPGWRAGEGQRHNESDRPVRDRAALRDEPRRERHQMVLMEPSSASPTGKGCRRCCTRSPSRAQRLGQARKLVDGDRYGVNLLDRRTRRNTTWQFLVFLCGRGARGRPARDLLRAAIAPVGGTTTGSVPTRRRRRYPIFRQHAIGHPEQGREGAPQAHDPRRPPTSAPSRCRSCRAIRATGTAPPPRLHGNKFESAPWGFVGQHRWPTTVLNVSCRVVARSPPSWSAAAGERPTARQAPIGRARRPKRGSGTQAGHLRR